MPYASNKQAAFMHIHHPDIAEKWHEKGHGYVKGGKNDPAKKKGHKLIRKSKRDLAAGLGVAALGGALANQIPPVQDVVRAEKKRKRAKGRVQKMLVPVSPDPDFNHVAAQKAFDLVMKMDDDSAEMFTYIVVSDLFEETVEKNLSTLQRHLNQTIAKQLEELKQVHLRLVSKGYDSQEAVAVAQAIALISKQLEPVSKVGAAQRHGYHWREEDFSRDPSSGRFRMKVSHNQQQLLRGKTGRQVVGAETPKETKDGRKLDEADRIAFQDEYRQLSDFLSAVNESTGGQGGNQEVMLHFRNKHNGRDFSQIHRGTLPPSDLLADPDYRLMGVDAKPTTLTAGGAAFGLATALGGNLTAGQVQGLNQVESGEGRKFTSAWLESGSEQNSNQKLYGRLAASGQFLSSVGPPGSKTQMAGKFAQIVGSSGPQAEAVLGPTARKTAYRYRGTEKTPDRALVRAYDQGVKQGKVYGELSEEERADQAAGLKPIRAGGRVPARTADTERRATGVSPAVHRMGAARAAAADRAPTWNERELGRRAVVEQLRQTRRKGGRAPEKGLYQLHLAAGNTPPSEGVIINANGQIAAQASGYGDDHYLPFNLKNLKALKGGEYIRTRSVGGLTSEDVYTGLISGARQVTVTSRSGTYVMTFEPDFRGGRRHNDKARRMTRRYEQLLDAVQSQQVERGEIDPEMRLAIENEVKDEMSGPAWRRGDIQEAVRERIEEFKENPYISEQDEKRADAIVNSRAAGANEKERAKIRAEVYDDLMDQKETRFRLNSEGYRAALEGLEEQFPYYIKTRYIPARDTEKKIDTERDLGYVEPGRNRPSAAAAGLFGGAKIPQYSRMGAKFSAREADYQGARGQFKAVEKPTETEGTEAKTSSTDEKQGVHDKRRAAIAEAKLDEQMLVVGEELQRHAKSNLNETSKADPKIAAALAMRGDELRSQDFRDWAEEYTNLPGFKELTLKRRWETASGHRNRRAFSRENTAYTKQPPTFDEAPYQLGADPKVAAREIMRVDRKAKGGVTNRDIVYSELSEAEAETEHRALARMYDTLKSDSEPLSSQELAQIGVDPTSPALVHGSSDLRRNPEAVLDQLELLQRSRALLVNMPEDQRKQLYEQSSKVVEPKQTPTSEEQAKPRQNVENQLKWGKKVLSELEDLRTRINQKLGEPGVNTTHREAMVRALEKLPDEETTERAQNAVAIWDNNQDILRTGEDFAAFNETMKVDVDALMKASAALSAQKEHVEILLNPPKRER